LEKTLIVIKANALYRHMPQQQEADPTAPPDSARAHNVTDLASRIAKEQQPRDWC